MKRLSNFRKQDLVTEVFRSVSFKSVIYFRSVLRAPWAFKVARRDLISFHIVMRGRCWLRASTAADWVKLISGDLVLFTRGDEHFIGDDPESSPKQLDLLQAKRLVDTTNSFRSGGAGPVTELVCGGFSFNGGRLNPALSALPAVIHIRGSSGRAPCLRTTLKLIVTEARANRPGAEGVITRLSDVLFIQAVRSFLSTKEGQRVSWLRALKDPKIGRAMNLIHSEPEFPWTVQSLGARAGMSRSVFAERFRTLVGESPLRYLGRWRLNNAAVLLQTTSATLAAIAERVGYESEFTFSRAFKRATGFSPGAYRKSGRKGSDVLL